MALLGTNGAGKSTLLKSISGVVEADRGAVIFDGREMTFAPPNEVAARGVVQVPGGAGVFPALTVAENLEVAGWPGGRSRGAGARHRARLRAVPRRSPPVARNPPPTCPGGQQQMLAIGMALISRPRLLMVDELSLGLAPVIVEQLLPVLRELADEGTTIILVDQSVNVALTIAETAYIHGEGRDPVPRTDGGAARSPRCAAFGVPRGRRGCGGGARRQRRLVGWGRPWTCVRAGWSIARPRPPSRRSTWAGASVGSERSTG